MRKLTAEWVPRLLTIDQKRRIHDSKSCLDLCNRNPSDFLHRLVNTDETWIHHYTPESKLFRKKENNQQRLLLCIIGLIDRINHKKRPHLLKKKCIFCTSSQIGKNDGKNQ